MFRLSSTEQGNMLNPLNNASLQAQKAVENSRAKLVGDFVYPNVDEGKFAPFFSENGSRPNISIRRYVSALILKRMYRMPDETMLEFLRSGAMNFQYALHTLDEESQPLSVSSLRRFRRKIEAYNQEHDCDLIKEEFKRISRSLALDMGVLHEDPNANETDEEVAVVRMDSMEIEAHARSMTRIEILYMTVVIMIRYLLRKDYGHIIPEELGHYLQDGDHNRVMYYRISEDKKAGVQDTRVSETINEMILLQNALFENFSLKFLQDIPEYQTFQRVLEEQTVQDEAGNRVPKKKEDISADSVQNPFDTTATYRYKRGQHHGFVLNLGEACDDNGNGIIIEAQIEANTTSDQKMLEAYLKSLPDDGPKQTMPVDGAYYTEELQKLAASKNVELQPTALTGKVPNDVIGDFVLNDEQTEIETCPAGISPTSCRHNPNNGEITATMPDNCCANCPNRDQCKAKVNDKKKKSTVKVTGTAVNRARRARSFSTDDGKANANRRNGVEGIMSVMRRKYGVDNIPVFGLERVKTWIWSTLLAYNLVKYQKFLRASQKQVAPA